MQKTQNLKTSENSKILFLGVPALPSGFPLYLYLCPLRYVSARKGCRSNP